MQRTKDVSCKLCLLWWPCIMPKDFRLDSNWTGLISYNENVIFVCIHTNLPLNESRRLALKKEKLLCSGKLKGNQDKYNDRVVNWDHCHRFPTLKKIGLLFLDHIVLLQTWRYMRPKRSFSRRLSPHIPWFPEISCFQISYMAPFESRVKQEQLRKRRNNLLRRHNDFWRLYSIRSWLTMEMPNGRIYTYHSHPNVPVPNGDKTVRYHFEWLS